MEALHHALGLDSRREVGEGAAVRREPPAARDVVRGVQQQLGAALAAAIAAVEVRAAVREFRVDHAAIVRDRDGEDAEAGGQLAQGSPCARREVDTHQLLRPLGGVAAAIDKVAPRAVEDGSDEQVGVAGEARQLAAGGVQQPQLGGRVTDRLRLRRQGDEGGERAGHLRRGRQRPTGRVRDTRDLLPRVEVSGRRHVDAVLADAELCEDEARFGRDAVGPVAGVARGGSQRGQGEQEQDEAGQGHAPSGFPGFRPPPG